MLTQIELRIKVEHDGTLTEDNVQRAVEHALEDCLSFEPVGSHEVIRLVNDGFSRLVEAKE